MKPIRQPVTHVPNVTAQTLGHAERLQALERLRLRIDAHMFIREDGELLGYGVTVPEMREFRELLIPFNGEIKIK
ncbi:hypothetical protein [Pseudomonas aeruginosa]|uniref:hypothetical protein n=1 Tax=Pseudomonas aeruginosa TaxID=287 RepID=UPI00137AF935|nr:hypothetical protein [Pseudomonas aeruginosa]